MRGYTIRECCVADAAVVAAHRLAMFQDMGEVPTAALAEKLLDESTRMLATELKQGLYVGWFAVSGDGKIISGAGAHIKRTLPRISPSDSDITSSPVPLAVNVYTLPEWRRQGIAKALMLKLMKWATLTGFDRVILHASDAGRPLYESLGFIATNEMRWTPPRLPRTD